MHLTVNWMNCIDLRLGTAPISDWTTVRHVHIQDP